eukprot:m.67330 g.67330  ORF g.67330 m.67330 type:complete len:432 (-) comp13823_c0_seq2:257-1552(-)
MATADVTMADVPCLPPGTVVHLDVCQKPQSMLSAGEMKAHCLAVLPSLLPQGVLYGNARLDVSEDNHLASLSVAFPRGTPTQAYSMKDIVQRASFHVFRLQTGCANLETDAAEGDEVITAATHWLLPNEEYHGLWQSLVYDSGIQQRLLRYAEAALLFSDKGVDNKLVAWNRVVLLHGPPGTGKTSLCKALAQQLSIRLSHRFENTQLVEINSHSLFSKWFSESGKLVMNLFAAIRELLEDERALVCVLIDEVESLTAARKASFSGTEPSDSIRVVNALLTQLDQIARHPNVIVLTTSNITCAVDIAFIDRADIKCFIGPPSVEARYSILSGSVSELCNKGIVGKVRLLPYSVVQSQHFEQATPATQGSLQLLEAARNCDGFSGRTLRKLPFVAFSQFCQSECPSAPEFLTALASAAEEEKTQRGFLNESG